jgi:hypothetical protein
MAKKVIMIDDNEDDLFYTQIVIERSGLNVALQKFTSAQDALSFFDSAELS